MYALGVVISFKIALLISAFLVISELRREANSLKNLGMDAYEINRYYREHLTSSSAAVMQCTIVAGSIFSLLSLSMIWVIS